MVAVDTHAHAHAHAHAHTHTHTHTDSSPGGISNHFLYASVILQQRFIIAPYCIISVWDGQEVQYPVLPNLPSILHVTQHLHEQRVSDNNLLLSRSTSAQS